MGFIELFFKKDTKELTSKDVEEFVTRRVEENLNLDYKDKGLIIILMNFQRIFLLLLILREA